MLNSKAIITIGDASLREISKIVAIKFSGDAIIFQGAKNAELDETEEQRVLYPVEMLV